MRRSMRLIIAVGVAALLISPGVSPAYADDESDTSTSETPTTLSERLVETVESGIDDPEGVASELSLPAAGGGSLSFDADGRVSATVTFTAGPGEAELSALADHGVVVTAMFPMFRAVSVLIDPLTFDAVHDLAGVRSIELDLQAFTGAELSGERSASGTLAGVRPVVDSLIDPPADAAQSCRTVPVEADAPLRSALARATFGADGSGVTVGILSDSYDTDFSRSTAADDIAVGALPGPGNPCGYETPVEVIVTPGLPPASDEGRAMAQLVHGVAPGAKLIVADSGRSQLGLAANIIALAEAGADIIVDDLSYPNESYFQRGFVSAAITEVKETHGVVYLSSIGNSNGVAAAEPHPIVSWQTSAYRPMECPEWLVQDSDDTLVGTTGFDCLDFDPSDAELAYDTLQLGSGSEPHSLYAIASVGEAIGGVTTEYQLRFYEVDSGAAPEDTPTLISTASSFGAASMNPGLAGIFEAAPNAEVRMVMVRTAFDDDGAYRFSGTSAAAPLAAAVAALGLSYQPGIPGALLEEQLIATAQVGGCCGPVNPYPAVNDTQVFGAGIVDAMGLLTALSATEVFETEATADSATVTWAPPGIPEEFTLMLFEGELSPEELAELDTASAPAAADSAAASSATMMSLTAARVPVDTVALPGTARSHTFTGLTPSTGYTVVTITHYAQPYSTLSRLQVETAGAPVPPVPTPDPSEGGSGGSGNGGDAVTPLPRLGGADAAPWIIGGTIVLLLAAAVFIVTGIVRSRRRARAQTSVPIDAAASTEPVDPTEPDVDSGGPEVR